MTPEQCGTFLSILVMIARSHAWGYTTAANAAAAIKQFPSNPVRSRSQSFPRLTNTSRTTSRDMIGYWRNKGYLRSSQRNSGRRNPNPPEVPLFLILWSSHKKEKYINSQKGNNNNPVLSSESTLTVNCSVLIAQCSHYFYSLLVHNSGNIQQSAVVDPIKSLNCALIRSICASHTIAAAIELVATYSH